MFDMSSKHRLFKMSKLDSVPGNSFCMSNDPDMGENQKSKT